MSWKSVSIQRVPPASRHSSLFFSIPPNLWSARVRASSAERPRWICFCGSISTWKRISSSISCSTRPLRKSGRKAASIRAFMTCSFLGRLEDPSDRGCEAFPTLRLLDELPAAGPRELVKLGAPVVLRVAPVRTDPALGLEPVKCRVERTLVDLEDVLRKLLDPLRDPPAVHRFGGEGLEDQNVESALEKLGFGRHALSPRMSTGVFRGAGPVSRPPLGIRQGIRDGRKKVLPISDGTPSYDLRGWRADFSSMGRWIRPTWSFSRTGREVRWTPRSSAGWRPAWANAGAAWCVSSFPTCTRGARAAAGALPTGRRFSRRAGSRSWRALEAA